MELRHRQSLDMQRDSGQDSVYSFKSEGGQGIGLWYSIILHINNCIGPALVAFPYVYANAGYLSTTIVVLIMALITGVCCTMLTQVIKEIPGNHDFQREVEFSKAVSYYLIECRHPHRFGAFLHRISQYAFIFNLMALNLAAAIVVVSVVDNFLIFLFGVSYGLTLYPSFSFQAATHTDTQMELHEDYVMVSVGLFVCMAMCLPFARSNLKENRLMQELAFWVLVITVFIFNAYFLQTTTHLSEVKALKHDQSQVLGTCIFSFAFVITIPTWAHEKHQSVNTQLAVWPSIVGSVVLKVTFGIFALFTFNHLSGSNILTKLTSLHEPLLIRICGYLFNVGGILCGIPPVCIMIRNNLIDDNVCGRKMAYFISSILPWMITILLRHKHALLQLINWSALLAMGYLNFVLPPYLYLKALKLREHGGGHGESNDDEDISLVEKEQLVDEALPEIVRGWISGKRVAQIIFWSMGIAISVNIAIAFYYLVVLRKDIVVA